MDAVYNPHVFIMKGGRLMPAEYRRLVWQISRNALVRKILCDRITDKAGVQRGRFPMLGVLLRHEGCTQCEIAEWLHISPASVAVSLRRMERDGLVRREADAGDQRCKRIYLTEAARKTADECSAAFEALNARMFSGLTEAELEMLERIQDRLFENIAGEEFRELSPFSASVLEQQNEKMEETDA